MLEIIRLLQKKLYLENVNVKFMAPCFRSQAVVHFQVQLQQES